MSSAPTGLRSIARNSRWLAGAAAICLIAADATAQTAAAPNAPEPQAAATVGEILVTARRRTESLQNVPVAVDVVSGAGAAAANLNDIQDISTVVPTVDFRTSASNKDRTIFIRGIGTISTSPGVEPSVSTVVDGVVLARSGMATLDLVDIDHIEVLEGPQGTLFGKNASAGVVNIVTANPTSTPHGFLSGAWYQGPEARVSGGVSGPILGDKLEGLIEGFTAQYKGNVENIYDGVDKEVNGYRHTGGRVKFIANPSDTLKLTLGADFTDSSDSVPNGVFVAAGLQNYEAPFTPSPALAAELATAGITPGPDNRTISNNTASSVHDKNAGVNFQADWTVFDNYTVTSITAFRKWDNTQYQDYDMIGFPTAASPGKAALPQGADTGLLDFKQTSQEVRLTSPKGKLVDYVVGLYYLHAVDNETYSRALTQVGAGGAPVNNLGVAHYGTTDDNFALYGEADINLTKRLRLIAGGRGVWDWLSYYHNRTSTAAGALPGIQPTVVNPPPGGPSSQDNISGYSDRFGVQYDLTKNAMVYFTYSRGYKGPAYDVFFNMNPGTAPVYFGDLPLAPETSNDYEAGIKSSWFDNRLRADLTGFITKFQNYQANFTTVVLGANVTTLINAGSVSTRGVEANLVARPTDALSLDFDGLYDDAKIDNFPCPPTAASSCNINGQPLPFAPRWKMHVAGGYRVFQTSAWDVKVESDYGYQSKTQYQLTQQPSTIQPAYGIWNADLALLGHDNGWQARFLVKNLLDTHYSSYLAGSNVGGGLVRWVPRDDDRYVGINLRKDF